MEVASPLHRVHGALQASADPADISRVLCARSLERFGDVCALTFNPLGISTDGLMINARPWSLTKHFVRFERPMCLFIYPLALELVW